MIRILLFFLFIVLLPSQLGKHWWPGWSLVDGVRVDYLAPTVYLTDIILLLLGLSIFITHIASLRGVRRQADDAAIPTRLPRSLRSLAMTGAFYILFIILRTPRPWLGIYWLLRYLEIPLVAFLTMEAGKTRGMRGNRWTGREIPIALGIAVLWSVGLGIAQMILGRTTGWFWWLGERNFNLATPGVATMTILGREILRPYATFGHPNALGGFLAAVIIFLKVQPWRTPRLDLLTTIGVIGVILTGSRGAMAGVIIAILLYCYIVKRLNRVIILGALVGLGVLGLSGISGLSGRSGGERLVLAEAAGRMWRENWVIGVGPGQFLVELPKYLPAGFYKIQPVHNVFLLGLAEFGVVGAGMGLISLISLMRQMSKTQSLKIWMAVLAVILVTGMVDHYWLTAQQNRLLLGVILGLVLAPRSISDSGLRLRSKK